mgnify:CR=1 FL=1
MKDLDANEKPCGYVVCYRKAGYKQFTFEQVWKRKFKSSVTCLSWDPSLNLLAVGYAFASLLLILKSKGWKSEYIESTNKAKFCAVHGCKIMKDVK